MKKTATILIYVFGLVFFGATILNAGLISKGRVALSKGVLGDRSSVPSARYHLIAILPETEDSFCQGLVEGIRTEAPAIDAAVQLFRYSGASAVEVERYFDIALRSKVDGLIMYAPRDGTISAYAERATKSGVAFIPVGTDAPAGRLPLFIGSGSILMGIEGGKIICSKLGSSARIGIILPTGMGSDPRDEPLYRGLLSGLQSYSGARIVAVVRSKTGALSGEESASNLLRANRSVNALFCTSSLDTTGAAQVVVDMNLVGKVLIVGADENSEILRYIEKRVIFASIVRDSRRIGADAVRAFSKIKAGQTVPATIEAGFTLRTTAGDKE